MDVDDKVVVGVIVVTLPMGLVVEEEPPPPTTPSPLSSATVVETNGLEVERVLRVRDPCERLNVGVAAARVVKVIMVEKPERRLVVEEMVTAEVEVGLSSTKPPPISTIVELKDGLEVGRTSAFEDPVTLNADNESTQNLS